MSQHTPLRLPQALDILNASVTGPKPRACHLVFCTADRKRGTGGQRVVFDRAALIKPLNFSDKPAANTSTSSEKGQNFRVDSRRYPINVKNITSGEIRRVHLDLIESINFHPVL